MVGASFEEVLQMFDAKNEYFKMFGKISFYLAVLPTEQGVHVTKKKQGLQKR